MSRHGYANVEAKLAEYHLDMVELPRHVAWIKGRQDDSGNFKHSSMGQKAAKIVKLEKRMYDSKLSFSGSEILEKSLCLAEQRGRVHDMGGFVTPISYFNMPQQNKKSVEHM